MLRQSANHQATVSVRSGTLRPSDNGLFADGKPVCRFCWSRPNFVFGPLCGSPAERTKSLAGSLLRHKRASNALHEAILSSESHFDCSSSWSNSVLASKLHAKTNAEHLCNGNWYWRDLWASDSHRQNHCRPTALGKADSKVVGTWGLLARPHRRCGRVRECGVGTDVLATNAPHTHRFRVGSDRRLAPPSIAAW